jgi:hypothetical protein
MNDILLLGKNPGEESRCAKLAREISANLPANAFRKFVLADWTSEELF